MNQPVQIHTGVERRSVEVATSHTVAKRVDASDAVIGIEIAELCGLHEADAAPVVGRARRKLVVAAAERIAERELSGSSSVVLNRAPAVDQAVALLGRLVP